MEKNYKIYLICYYAGQPLDFLLPVYTDKQFTNIKEVAGTCFKVHDPKGAEITLACRKDGGLQLIKINIESACKADSNISFAVVLNTTNGTASLRAFTDNLHNAYYPIPTEFMEQAYCAFY